MLKRWLFSKIRSSHEVGHRMSWTTAPNSPEMSSSLFCSRRTVAQSTACTTLRLWLCTMVPGKCVMASHVWEKHGAGQQSCTTPDNSPSTPPQNGVRYIKVSEVEFSFNLGVKEYS